MINKLFNPQKPTPFESAAEERKKVLAEKYQKIMDTIDKAIFKKGLLTDYMTETGEGKPNTWKITIPIDPNFYTEIREFLIGTFKSMALTVEIKESNIILENQITATIGIDDNAEPDMTQKETLKKRGWAWDRLNKTALKLRVNNEIKAQQKLLSAEVGECIKKDPEAYQWSLWPKDELSVRVLQSFIKEELNKKKYTLSTSFEKPSEEGEDSSNRLKLTIFPPKKNRPSQGKESDS